jgi:hypothetical protein
MGLGVVARVEETKISPGGAEELTHNCCAKFGVGLALHAIHVGFAHIADVVEKERDPQSWINREAVQLRPTGCDKPRVQGETVRAE